MKALIRKLRVWADSHASKINHQAVAKDIHSEVEVTPGYFLSLNVANLIALCGLLVGSSPVIIGAMLISPFMGPILSFGFAFVTGDEIIWQKAIRKILISIAMSILLAALASYLSPLKELTGEILARTRPNLFDLIIAFLAGIVGAGAICTKKNFLTIVPGVAIATAVIPPLSVTGFGIAILDFKILSGGFLLFFTNFVAIILATCIVFYYYGFRREMVSEVELSQMKKRFAFLIGVLLVISIPLALTLKSSITELRMKTSIGNALRQELEQEKKSHLVNFNYVEEENDRLSINVLLNTVRYLSEEELEQVQKLVERSLARNVSLNLEQVLVQAGGLKPDLSRDKTAMASALTSGEVVRLAKKNVRSAVQKSINQIERIITPATIPIFAVSFDSKSDATEIRFTMQRDEPISLTENLWMARMLSDSLEVPVTLQIEQIPYVPPLTYKFDQIALSDSMEQTLASFAEIYRLSPGAIVNLEGLTGRAGTRARKDAAERVQEVSEFLADKCRIPAEHIRTAVNLSRDGAPKVKVSLLQDQSRPGRND